MARFASLIAAAALAASAAAPVAAQYQQPYPQQYPQPYQQTYPQPGYPSPDQNYGTQGTIGGIIDSLIGNRYNVSDRQAIRQCAFAAVQRAQSGGYPGYSQAYPGYNNSIRVTAITDVQRRSNGVRVHGMLGNGRAYNQPYDPRFPNGGGNRWGRGDVSFRCDVDYRGYVRNVRLLPAYRGY
ncbi:MAG TPA: hypothetical protein VGQ34_06775 [Sphingomicrobium sp.]|nr:hypothetical protein [Sphingomicrobium sp.]